MHLKEYDQSTFDAIYASSIPTEQLALLAIVADSQGYEYTRFDNNQEGHANGVISGTLESRFEYYNSLWSGEWGGREQLRSEAILVLQAYGWTLETLTFP